MRLIKPALIYFILIFATGFALAMIRIPFLVPRLGERWAELIELPFMVLASFLVARWLVQRFRLVTVMQCIGTGLPALLMMLSAELAVMWFQGQSLGEYLGGRDPVSGMAYLFSLLLFAAMPLLVRQQAVNRP
ncbi:hypothetical protein [uncultured Alcanivorax sp.]|jgi:hypothetical protein|uniref:hypothetical protein n=3 Tax=Alcanivorax TaxID=59753 RepID=UPI002607FAF4|nr:hypothetical protein [uncultured Alcanivorax sp.]